MSEVLHYNAIMGEQCMSGWHAGGTVCGTQVLTWQGQLTHEGTVCGKHMYSLVISAPFMFSDREDLGNWH